MILIFRCIYILLLSYAANTFSDSKSPQVVKRLKSSSFNSLFNSSEEYSAYTYYLLSNGVARVLVLCYP